MKNYFAAIATGCLLTLSISLSAQSPFSKVFYDSLKNGIQANTFVKTLDNGYLIAGESPNGGLIIKIDSIGNLVWNKEIRYGENDIFYGVVATNDSGFVLAGSTYDTTRKIFEVYCVKITSKGDTIWSKTIHQKGYENTALAVQQTFDNGYILTGYTTDSDFNPVGIFAAKLNKNGVLQWTNILAFSDYGNVGFAVKETPDSGYAIVGYINSGPPDYEQFTILIKLNPGGQVSWANKYRLAPAGICEGTDVEVTNDGFLCILNTGVDITFMKTDLSGNILSTRSYEGFNTGLGVNSNFKFNKTSDNGYVFGSAQLMFKTDSSGNFLWGNGILFLNGDAVESGDKGFLILGNGPVQEPLIMGFVPGSPQIGIIKTDSLGIGNACILDHFTDGFPGFDTLFSSPAAFTSLSEGTGFAIHPAVSSMLLASDTGCILVSFGGINDINSINGLSIYPNPSTGYFTIRATNAIIRGTVEIYNIVGEKIFVENIFNESKKEINLQNISPGIYIVKVTDGNKESVQKLIVQ